MPRPSRCRRICLEPSYVRFAPCGFEEGEEIQLTVDEYEAVRLIEENKHMSNAPGRWECPARR